MANVLVKDGHANDKYLKATGAGTDGDPFITKNQLANESGDSIDSDNPLAVREHSVVSPGNSTSTPVAGDAVVTGAWEDILQYSAVIVAVKSDVASATDGLALQFGPDGSTVVNEDCFTIAANTGKTFSFQPSGRYCRIVYTNGSSAQSTFSLETQYKADYIKPSSHRVKDQISREDDAELSKSVITGEGPDGFFHNVNTTRDGDLLIADNSSGLAIAEGLVTGKSFIHKFGAAPDFDTGDNEVTIWDGADDGALWENMAYDYSTTADIDSISSSSAADTSLSIEISGLDANYDVVIQTVVTNASDGRTRVAIPTPLMRVFRMKNITNGQNIVGGLVAYPNTALTTGVPTDKSKIRAVINDGNNQTEMAVYTIPNGYTGYMRSLFGSTAGASKSSDYIIKLKSRPFQQVFQLKHRFSVTDVGTSFIQHTYIEPEVFQAKTDIEMTVQMTAVGGSGAAIAGGFDIVLVAD